MQKKRKNGESKKEQKYTVQTFTNTIQSTQIKILEKKGATH